MTKCVLTSEADGLVDLGLVADRLPSLSSLTFEGYGTGDRFPASLVEADLADMYNFDLSPLGQCPSLERLMVTGMASPLPVGDLVSLRRLVLFEFNHDVKALVAALASAPCVATLEALSVDTTVEESSGRWASLPDLSALRELCVAIPRDRLVNPSGMAGDVDELFEATLLCKTLRVLDVCLSVDDAGAISSRGLPPGTRALRVAINGSAGDRLPLENLVPVLPNHLVALHFCGFVRSGPTDLSALFRRCCHLSVLAIPLHDETVDHLINAETGPRRSLITVRAREDHHRARLEAAGYRVSAAVVIEVAWNRPGGLFVDKRPVFADHANDRKPAQ